MGEQSLRDVLWVPHVFLANERSSDILGTAEKDILTSVSPDGTVIISTRISATLYCWMNLQKFPFDEQHCSTVLESCKWDWVWAGFGEGESLMCRLVFFCRDVQPGRSGPEVGEKIAGYAGAGTSPDGVRSAEYVYE